MTKAPDLTIKVFADGAELDAIAKLSAQPLIKGFTTNPTLMRKAGVSDYRAFAHAVLGIVTDKPVSFEVFADDFEGMRVAPRAKVRYCPRYSELTAEYRHVHPSLYRRDRYRQDQCQGGADRRA